MLDSDRRRFVNTRTWNTEEAPDHFPELDDTEGLKVPWLDDARRNFGVAFSGGGTRSASATLGQLRGLKASGLLDKVGYVSVVSGGSWGSAAWMYLQPGQDEDLLLGQAKDPGDLKTADFEDVPKGSQAFAISKSKLGKEILTEKFKPAKDETYSRIVGDVFLEPFGLDDLQRFFSFHPEAVAAAVAGNPQVAGSPNFLEPGDFYTVRSGRPYYIAAGTILRLRDEFPRQKIQCEYTPLYTGVRKLFPAEGKMLPIGGGYVESFAYDSENPTGSATNGRFRVELGKRRHHVFTLSDALGSTSAAPEEVAIRLHVNLSFPEFRHWPIDQIGQVGAKEYAHGDGGLLENLGLMPLLARQVRNIIVFVNTNKPWNLQADEPFANSLEPLFRPVRDREAPDEMFGLNVVFPEAKFQDLKDGIQNQKRKGAPLVFCDTYEVQANDQYKIRPYEARICWVYNDQVSTWIDALSAEGKDVINRRSLRRFPFYRTFLENPPHLIDLTGPQVNALAHISSWNVTTNAERIAAHFGL